MQYINAIYLEVDINLNIKSMYAFNLRYCSMKLEGDIIYYIGFLFI